MRIAFINIYQNKVARGAETFVYELSRRLSKNHEVKIFTSLKPLEFFRKKYDVVIPVNGRLQAIFTRILTWLTGAKMIISGQSGIGFDDRLNLYTCPNVFVALTEFQKDWAKKINPFIQVVKIPNGVSFEKEEIKKIDFGLPKPVILSVGALEENKRHELTIKAVARIPDASLLIIGKGSKENEIKKNGEKYLKGRFSVVFLPYSDIGSAYKYADVFAFPTVPWESFGIVLLEAMKEGLPVVANNDPIRSEIVGNAGILVNPTNTDEYAYALKKVLNVGFSKESVMQANKYNWDIIANQYEKLFANLIKKS